MARNHSEGVERKACPVCGGTITVSWLYQYSHDYIVNKNGKLSKRYTTVDVGPMEVAIASCKNCRNYWEESDFQIVDDRFIDLKVYKEEME